MAIHRTDTGIGPLLQAVCAHVEGKTDGQLLEQFLVRRDEAAFAALVRRHGPMVLGVCRRVLGDATDAEDAFQAAFLVLLRKAPSLTARAVVGDWLHGVARRTALKARAAAAQRRAKERALARPEARAEEVRNDWLPVLDEELSRLPEKYRLPLVLCDLEGQTRREAAERLGWPEGTVAGRLARGRALLAKRLLRGARAMSAVLPASLLGSAARATAPVGLVQGTVCAAALVAAGEVTAQGALTAEALTLANEVGQAMLGSKVRSAAMVLLLVVLCGVGFGAVGFGQVATPPPKLIQRAAPQAKEGTDALGDPLPPGALRRLGTNRLTHQGNVSCTAFSPDGRFLASGGYDGAVRLWDPATGKEVGRFQCPRWVRALVWSADGKILIYASDGDGIRIREVATGNQLQHFPVQNGGAVVTLALTRDGKTLAAGETDFTAAQVKHNTVRLWDVSRGQELYRFLVERAYCLAFSPDGRTLAVGGAKKVRLWAVGTGKERPPFEGHRSGTYAVAFSPDGKLLASGGTTLDETVILWDTATGRALRRLPKLGGTVYSLAFSVDGKTLATGASGGAGSPLRLWEVATGKERRDLKGITGLIDEISFSPDGKRLVAACSWGRTICLWDVATGETVRLFARHQGEVAALAFSPNGQLLATGSHDRTVLLWKTATGEELRPLRGHRDKVYAVAFSPDGRLVASGSEDKTIRLWKVATGKELRLLQVPTRRITSVAFSPDGRTLASGEGMDENRGPGGAQMPDCAVRLWDVATGKTLRQFEAKAGRVATVAFSPDGHLLASAGPDERTIHLWDPATGRELRKLDSPPDLATPRSMAEGITRVAFSPDGRTLASVSRYRYASNLRQIEKNKPRDVRTVRLWEVATGAERFQIRGPQNEVTCVAFSADGQTLILGKTDGNVSLWDVPTGKEVRRLAGHPDRISVGGKMSATESWDSSPRVAALALSPDGKTFATGSWDTTALLWDGKALGGRQRPRPAHLTAEQRETLWADLAAPDGPRASRAIWALVATPQDTLPLLKERLKLVPRVEATRLARLIQELDSSKFAVREQATTALDALGEVAVPALRKAAAAQISLESRRRLEKLLAKFGGPLLPPTGLRALRAAEILEYVGSPEAQQLLQALARGAPEARLTQEARGSLERLARRSAISP